MVKKNVLILIWCHTSERDTDVFCQWFIMEDPWTSNKKDRCMSYSNRLSTTLSVNLNIMNLWGGRENITKEAEQLATSRTEAPSRNQSYPCIFCSILVNNHSLNGKYIKVQLNKHAPEEREADRVNMSFPLSSPSVLRTEAVYCCYKGLRTGEVTGRLFKLLGWRTVFPYLYLFLHALLSKA